MILQLYTIHILNPCSNFSRKKLILFCEISRYVLPTNNNNNIIFLREIPVKIPDLSNH